MRCYEIAAGSTSLEGLKRAERPDPRPSAREVLVRVRACSLNYRDQAVVTGNYFGGSVQRNTIPLSDGAGEVVAIGPAVTRFQVGDRVAGTFFQTWIDGPPRRAPALGSPLDGMLAEYVALDEDGVVPIASTLSYEEAACLPCAGVTAWHALASGKRLLPGDVVLAIGTGGVAMLAVQIASAMGARVVVTSSSDEKIARAKAIGAFGGVNYRTRPDWADGVLELTGGRGADHVVELGGAGTLAQSFKALAMSGEINLIGVLAGHQGDTGPHALMLKGGNMRGIFVGSAAMATDLNRAIDANGIKPVIGKTFGFDEARAAWEYALSPALFGKVVITV
ncbi:MAG: NAD(P)-dependent alcohol dehydrogenase [Hyphomonadaceae bacterium]|nr:NAD(P)-dependent alcohol dehydrogenase [Hyphomonadaceae bacterium]